MLQELLIPFISFVFIVIYIIDTKKYRWDVVKFPYFIFILMGICALALLYREYKIKVNEKSINRYNKKEKGEKSNFKEIIKNETKPVLIFLIVLGYVFLLNQIGYILPTFIFLGAIMAILKANIKSIIIFIPIVTISLYVLFSTVFNIGLPRGFIENWILNLL